MAALGWLMNLGFAASGADAPVVIPDAAQTPAGRSRRRHYVEIDGQNFPVDSASQAIEILQRARAIAERQAEAKASVAEKRLRRKAVVPAVKIAAPVITASPEIREEVIQLIADIERLYAKAAQSAELRLLLLKQMEAEDDDDDVLLLI